MRFTSKQELIEKIEKEEQALVELAASIPMSRYQEVLAEFEASYEEVLGVARELYLEELFTRGYFPWTKQTALATYLAANTSSHYHSAARYIKRWLRQ